MHLKKYSYLSQDDLKEIHNAFTLVREKKVIPSMRSIQFGGKAIQAHESRIYNCAVKHVDSIRSFPELFYLLLCGCGVGIGLSDYFLNRLPDLVNEKDKSGVVISYQIQDNIEGWADSVEALLNCYFKNTAYTGRKIIFDYSRIRKKGEPLKTGGGRAPGYKGLKECHIKIKKLLDFIIEVKEQTRLKSINAYDIIMHCADAVLSGGIRRSACSVIFSKDDIDLMEAKTYQKVDKVYTFYPTTPKIMGGKEIKCFEGRIQFETEKIDVILEEWEIEKLQKENLIDWRHVHPQRGRSNNSVLLIRSELKKDELEKIIERTKQFGEPGFVFGNHKWQLFNPCFEIGFIPVTKDGICGVQFCNLTSINGRLCDTKENFIKFSKASALIGTLQAGYTHFPYLSNACKELTENEALLGCSIAGILDNKEVLLNPDFQKEVALECVKTNKEWAKKIGIKQAARVTCIKPDGNTSVTFGSAPGAHAHHSRRYFRRIQMNKNDSVYKFFKKLNPKMCEHSIWSTNKTDDVITFPIIAPSHSMIKADLTALEHLEMIKSTQKNWVMNGASETNAKDIMHNVSCTVLVKDDEWNDVINYLFNNKDYFAAVSLLSNFGESVYVQAPYQSILNEDLENHWKEIVSTFKPVNYKELKENDDNTNLSQEMSCFGGSCSII
jgi:ribonucleoside-diphosphate reductase alpha chain